MSAETEVVWKCGSCDECFYDLQILATHKCIGAGGTVALSESCIKQLQSQSFEVAELDNSNQDIETLSIIERSDLQYPHASYHKPTIVSIKKKGEPKKHQKQKRSIVWTYFTALDDKKAMCCMCHRVISYCGTPTNLVYHLSRYHPDESAIVKGKQANNVKYQYLTSKLPNKVKKRNTRGPAFNITSLAPVETVPNLPIVARKGNTTEKIIEMLLVDMLPVSILEGNGFKKLVTSFDPSYKLPPAKDFFIDLIPKKYYAEYKKVQTLLQDAEKVHVSVELWTGYENQSFLTVSSHFVTNNFQYRHSALTTIAVNEVDAENLRTEMVSAVSQWNISMEIMCIVTNSGDIMDQAADLTGWTKVTCFAHTLNDIIKTSLSSSEELTALIDKCRSVVDFLRNNENAKQQLLEAQMHDKNLKMQHAQNETVDINAGVDKKFPLKVKKDHPNEWISTFYMLQRIATLRKVLTKLFPNFSAHVQPLTKSDWTAIDETVSLLKAFEVLTLELCNEPYQIASKVIPLTLGLNSLINNCSSLTLASIQNVRKAILSALQSQFGEVEHNLMLAMATILDPRFKNIAFQSEFAVEAAVQELTSEASKHVTIEHQVEQPKEEPKDTSSYCDSLWERFEKRATPKKPPKNDDVVSSEIKSYLEEPLLDRKKNPFLWWKTQGQAQFPILAKMAKHILCIPATSMPPDRVFLKKGRVFSEKRKLIKPKFIDQFMFLNMNIE